MINVNFYKAESLIESQAPQDHEIKQAKNGAVILASNKSANGQRGNFP